mgnify:CR=1 FL=1
MTFKEQIVARYQLVLRDRLELFQDMLTNMSSNLGNDAKSSAGDKHETGLAMMHLEQEKLNAKLTDLINHKKLVQKLPENEVTTKIGLGSLVKTDKALFYVSIAFLAFKVQNQMVMFISSSAPLMQVLLNKEVGTEVVFNNISYKILEIL